MRIRTTPKVGGTVPPPSPELPSLPPQCTPLTTVDNEVRYCYDEFERMLVAKGSGVGKDAGVYEYDGFDRRDRMTVKKLTGDEPRDLSYVGSARLLSRERDASGNTKYYDYDSSGVRVGQARAPTTTPDPSTFRSYGQDANGSVEQLEEADGTVATGNRYVYDPYGALDTRGGLVADDPEEHLSADAKANPFRFQGFYYDSGVKDYDMQARHYRPDVGRFTSQDRFESARGDFNLQADPLTQNRYVFGGANPVNNVEFDGHDPHGAYDSCRRGGGSRCGNRAAQQTRDQAAAGARDTGGPTTPITGRGGRSTWRPTVTTPARGGRMPRRAVAGISSSDYPSPSCHGDACARKPRDASGDPMELAPDAWGQAFSTLQEIIVGDPLHNPLDALTLLPTPAKWLRLPKLRRLSGTGARATSAAQGALLRAQLTAEQIASGHAYKKHAGDFPEIKTREHFRRHVEDVILAPSHRRNLRRGRQAWWRDDSGTVVIRDPRSADGGTAFRPRGGYGYFRGLR